MQNITIGRYKPLQHPLEVVNADTDEHIASTDVSNFFDGWIEGVRDDGSTWIMWLDAAGNPTVFYPKREESGGVDCDPIDLSAP